MKLKIYFYKSSRGDEIVKKHIKSLDQNTIKIIDAFFSKFRGDENFRKMPYCRKVSRDIFEIRIKTKLGYRILFAYMVDDVVLLLHIFKKKSNKIPKKELKLAIQRLKTYE
jgi:phage-related protein